MVIIFSGLDGVNQSDMLLNGGKSARDEIVYNVDQYPPFTYGHGAIRWERRNNGVITVASYTEKRLV